MRRSIFSLVFSALLAFAMGVAPAIAQQSYAPGGAAPEGVAAQAPTTPGQPVTQPSGPANQPYVGPPFQLSPVEQQYVDQILHEWEIRGAEVKTFDCRFDLWQYSDVFGPATLEGSSLKEPMIKSTGRLTYSRPDKGSFKIEDIFRYVKQDDGEPGTYELQENEVGNHWVCDGKAVYEYKHEDKQLVVQKLPEEMRGVDIVDGPLPFLFGAKADKLKSRYWIRSKQSNATTIWLEAFPRTQADAANYHHVDVMLERKTMLPKAIQVHQPSGQERDVYMFKEPTINGTMDKLFGGLFDSPRTPFGWKKVVVDAPQQSMNAGPQASNPQGATQNR